MALDFPDNPAIGQAYGQWQWSGSQWTTGPVAGTDGPPGGQPVLVVNASVVLPAGSAGFIRIENTTGGPITVTLPSSPGQASLILKDTAGNAGTWPITIGGGGSTIEGQGSLVLPYNYSWAELIHTGSQWVQI